MIPRCEGAFARVASHLFSAFAITAALGWAVWVARNQGKIDEMRAMRAIVLTGQSMPSGTLARLQENAPSGLDQICSNRLLDAELPVRARLLEQAVAAGNPADVAMQARSVDNAALKLLACSPYRSFAWLLLYWARGNDNPSIPDYSLLEMSFKTAPREGWISLRRNAIVLSDFGKLPTHIQREGLNEFAGLLESRYEAECADAYLNYASEPVRVQLRHIVSQRRPEVVERFINQLVRRGVDRDAITAALKPAA